MKGSYNYIAPYYDCISKIIFGNAIVNVQRYLVDFIDAGSTILIVGGGTGWILERIAVAHPRGLNITYVDISSKMIDLSAKRKVGDNKVVFINGAIQDIQLTSIFDIVITPFLLDNFSSDTVRNIFKKIDTHLTQSAIWMFADFQVGPTHRLWQQPLLKLMYYFFRTICNIEANCLPDTGRLFQEYGYKTVASKTFFHDFISGVVFQKAR